jgi:type VI secretion system protein ImpL
VPTTTRALNTLLTLAEQGDYGLTLPLLIGASNAFQPAGKLRGAYTRRGYENVVRDALAPQILEDAGELWVLGLADNADQAKQQRDEQLRQLRAAYFAGYIAEWQEFLRGVRVVPAGNHTASLELLRELTRVPAPVQRLIERVHYNTQLEPKPGASTVVNAAVDGAVDKLKSLLGAAPSALSANLAKHDPTRRKEGELSEADVARAFSGFYRFAVPEVVEGAPPTATDFDRYQEQLVYVRNALQAYLDDPSGRDPVQARLQEARVQVRGIIGQQQVGYRPLFEALLWPPVGNTVSAVGAEVAGTQADSWCSEVFSEFARTIAGHYPFNRDGQDLPLSDFINFYKPKQGRLWTFVDTVLAKDVQLDGDRYVLGRKLGEDAANVYAPVLLEFLARSRDITRSYFPAGESAPSIEFEVKVHPSPAVATTQFLVGGKGVEHQNGPEQWKTLAWPGQDPAVGAAIVIRGANGMHERIQQDGPWGLLRLLEAGSLRSGAGRTFTIAWQLQTHDVTLQIDFRPKRGESPFFGVEGQSDPAILLQPVRAKGVTVPRQILIQGRPCKS